MYYEQKGWKVTRSRMLGYIFLAAITSCLLLYVIGIWLSVAAKSNFDDVVTATLNYAIVLAAMAILAIYQLWKFPNIVTSSKGLDLKIFFYTKHVEWKNVLQVQKGNHHLLIFIRNKGLLLNRLYGLFDAKVWDRPVVIFSSTDEMVNRLEEDIRAHLVSNLH